MSGPRLGGLYDRQGRRRIVFDLDGTHNAYRQRAVAKGADRPAYRRRAAALAVPGYTGRKRGEVVRARLTVQQAHTSEWLGTYGEAGNGERWPRVEKAADGILQYMRAHGLTPSAALLRFDGEFGWAHTMILLAARDLGYLMRCMDYRLLKLPQVQQALQEPPQEMWQILGQWVWNQRLQLGLVAMPCAPRCTLWFEALLVGDLATASSSSAEVSTSDVAATTPSVAETKEAQVPSVGHVSDLTMAPPSSAPNADGYAPSVESVDPVSTTSPNGAPSASVAGSASAPLTELTDAAQSTGIVDLTLVPPTVIVLAEVKPAPLPARKGFVLQPDGTLLCPAKKVMRRTEVRDHAIRFMARPTDCRACPKRAKCIRPGSSGINGRRVDWLVEGAVPKRARPTLSRAKAKKTLPPPAVVTPPASPGPAPLSWHDLPGTRLRRWLPASLRQQLIEGLPPTCASSIEPRILTRDQRAHRRLTWDARLARNARHASAPVLRLHLHGIPATLAAYLGLRGDG